MSYAEQLHVLNHCIYVMEDESLKNENGRHPDIPSGVNATKRNRP